MRGACEPRCDFASGKSEDCSDGASPSRAAAVVESRWGYGYISLFSEEATCR